MFNEIRFLASTVNCYTENDVLIIGAGDDPVSPNSYLIISRLDDGDIDESIGIQTHLSEMEVSNAISDIFLSEHELVVKIKENKSTEVNTSRMVVLLDNSTTDLKSLEKYVNKIFSGSTANIEIKIK
ncbi:Uncharacterised protein [Serratia fonticola]|uniref:hypothetical protein n=1 Tax=Serratia fonticola TaxID=47917 RepID=UPI002183A4AB|nr:hypothetical protein [Serratia fonticola]CAI2112032.1 Uncharacterised protein [Serratia fonticola]